MHLAGDDFDHQDWNRITMSIIEMVEGIEVGPERKVLVYIIDKIDLKAVRKMIGIFAKGLSSSSGVESRSNIFNYLYIVMEDNPLLLTSIQFFVSAARKEFQSFATLDEVYQYMDEHLD